MSLTVTVHNGNKLACFPPQIIDLSLRATCAQGATYTYNSVSRVSRLIEDTTNTRLIPYTVEKSRENITRKRKKRIKPKETKIEKGEKKI